jgi:hypothetical protein
VGVRVSWIVATASAAVLAAPNIAQAHLRGGTVAVDYGANVIRPRPSRTAPLTVGVYQSDRALHLGVRHGHVVVVIGYLGESFLRVDAAGLAVNRASPTAAVAGLLAKGEAVGGDVPRWRLVPRRSSVVWHDPRLQRPLPRSSRVSWSIPILVDGRRERISGEIWRRAAPALWPWLLVLGLFVALAAVLGVRKDVQRLRTGCILMGATAAAGGMVATAGLVLSSYALPGIRIAGADGVVVAAVGFGVLAWGPREARVPAGVGLGLAGLAVGSLESAVFLHAGVLSALPAMPTRVGVALAIAAGVACLITGALFYLQRAAESVPEGGG